MSSVESLVCPHCGADLDVPDGVSILRCKYCGSKLQLKESGSVRALALIEKGLGAIGDNTARTADGVERLHQEVVSQHAAKHSRWLNKLNQLQTRANSIRRRAGRLKTYGFVLFLAWVLVATYTYPVAKRIDGVEDWYLAVLFVPPVVCIVLALQQSAMHKAALIAEEEVKAWRIREPL